jgi:hypothetical protein
VHLRHRRGRDGLGLEVGEHLLERAREVLLDDAPHLGERERRHAVAQGREFVDQTLGQQVAARRRDLPDLDEGRAEPAEQGKDAAAKELLPLRAAATLMTFSSCARNQWGEGKPRPSSQCRVKRTASSANQAPPDGASRVPAL